MRTLVLVSPHMKGPDVKNMQVALKKNEYEPYYQGRIDGIYGPLTAQAAATAKHWLGYPKREIDQDAGQVLLNLLTGKSPLPRLYRFRRDQRLKNAATAPMSLKALEAARAEIGNKEVPTGSNRTLYGKWYGWDGVAWCFIFVSWCYDQAGGKLKYAYCPYGVADARAGRNGLAIQVKPRPGDIVFFDWKADGVSDHVGLFDRWLDEKNGLFESIEGNTAVGNDSNGGQVMLRQRSTKHVVLFARYTNP